MNANETITAISTAPGLGAIAIVRLSGPKAHTIIDSIFSRSKEAIAKLAHEDQFDKPFSLEERKATFGYIFDPDTHDLLDEVVVIAYKGPHSYSGEDLVEINCHGSPVVTRAILEVCIKCGSRLARAGEFTERAFVNGRMDLTQAEAVLDLIQSKTLKQSQLAQSALSGHLGLKINEVRTALVELLTRIVAGIDFPEEVGDLPFDDLTEKLSGALEILGALAHSAKSGRFLRNGLSVAIVGRPNAGKSSLLNCLLKYERAIVTDIPGTTRDSIEELLDLQGIPVTLIDTAGIRHTDEPVERIGIDRTRKAIEQADLVLLVTDSTIGFLQEEETIVQMVGVKPYILLANKSDLITDRKPIGKRDISEFCLSQLFLSAKTETGLTELIESVVRFALKDGLPSEAGGSLNERQAELCNRAIQALSIAKQAALEQLPQDCLATDIKSAIDALSEISGLAVSDEVITNVFKKFCIGK